MKELLWTATLLLMSYLESSSAQCPWHREVPELQSSCLCSFNLGRELSVQCDMVIWSKLLSALNSHATLAPIDLLYVNNSTIGALENDIFINLEIHNIQLSGCKISLILDNAFEGQELFLKNLNLQDNDISVIPVEALKNLRTLQLLDLSHNRINSVPEGAFETLTKLATLKLSDNNVTLSNGALKGLEKSLKNLNLKGTAQKRVPKAIQGMKTLAFLDLSQNSIRELPSQDNNNTFEGLESLTALNLERNILQNLDSNAFYGIRKTLSSLSLLNNLLADFPTAAMSILSELRVLDIGFNLLTELPYNAFRGNPSITLLALDGNPLTTIPFEAFAHLNSTLRGLSLGGRFLHCDCRLSWVIQWIRNKDLQVTSRERNPQFCGSPPRFRDRSFYSIQPDELQCKSKPTIPKPVVKEPVGIATVISADLEDLILPQQSSSSSTTTTELSTTSKATTTITKPSSTSTTTKITTTTTSTSSSTSTTAAVTKAKTKTTSSWKNTARPPVVMSAYPVRNKSDDSKEVMVKNAFRQDNSVIIQWDSQVVNILGFRVVYRLFADKSFKQGPPLEASEREFKIKNVPSQECIIVCVVSLEDLNITPETVPFTQCREVRTVSSASSNMDKITIVASAAICGTIVVAVIVFIAATRRRSKKLHEFHQQKMSLKHRVPVPGLPVNCCKGMAASPGEGMPSLVTLNAFSNGKDWDQVSAYSTQRPRMYPVDQPQSFDELRSNFSTKGAAKARSVADGQSQNSFSNHSGRFLANDFQNNLLAVARQDLRASRQSLAMLSERVPNRPQSHHGTVNQSVHSSTRGSRPRSRTRDGHHHRRPSSRYSTADSTHSLNQYCENSDNWTDHDMDIYMTRGHTARNSGLVPL